MGARKCRSSQTCNKVVDGLDVRVQLGYNRGCVICDGHDHGRSSSSKMLVPRRGLSKETRGEQNCFIKLWSLERLDDGPAEAFMGSPAHLTPPVPPSIWAHDSNNKSDAQSPIILEYDGQATTEDLSSDNVARTVRVDSCSAVKQICRHFLGIEDNNWLPCCT
jgi:hypothetical protein